jgi:trans-aconitate 2-methyltransferase
MTREWNAEAYHQVSTPQTTWGQRVLARLALDGDERVIDAGCGSGRLTGDLLDRLPLGRVLAIDRSWNMLQTARANLRPSHGHHVWFAQVALPLLPVVGWADVVFSAATFHWVSDHPTLFAQIQSALKPGGRLHAQYGGGPNLARAHALATSVMRESPFAEHFTTWQEVWTFSTAEEAARQLMGAGFTDIHAWLEPAPALLASAEDYRAFIATVNYRAQVAALPPSLQNPFLDRITELAGQQDEPFLLDYWRVNISATRPSSAP